MVFTSLGVKGVESLLKWLEEYLTGRHQWVVLGESAEQVMSEKVTLKQGVPQGSILGPILFTLYTSPLGISVGATILCFIAMLMTSKIT